jgi:hypothetical protein
MAGPDLSAELFSEFWACANEVQRTKSLPPRKQGKSSHPSRRWAGRGVATYSLDEGNADRLWNLSRPMLG